MPLTSSGCRVVGSIGGSRCYPGTALPVVASQPCRQHRQNEPGHCSPGLDTKKDIGCHRAQRNGLCGLARLARYLPVGRLIFGDECGRHFQSLVSGTLQGVLRHYHVLVEEMTMCERIESASIPEETVFLDRKIILPLSSTRNTGSPALVVPTSAAVCSTLWRNSSNVERLLRQRGRLPLRQRP